MIRACFLVFLLSSPAYAQGIQSARFTEPTGRYGHHPMGPTVSDHGALELTLDDGTRRLIRLPNSRVFEDSEVRMADVTGDGWFEAVVVESDQNQGARVSVYGADGLIAASPFIGRRNRWFAVSGVGDLDGDGRVEIVAVDRPHLRRTLVIWRREGERLVPVAEMAGVTNHRFNDADIRGGLRDCGAGSEIILARADWSGLVAVQMQDGVLARRDLGDGASPERFAQAMACQIP